MTDINNRAVIGARSEEQSSKHEDQTANIEQQNTTINDTQHNIHIFASVRDTVGAAVTVSDPKLRDLIRDAQEYPSKQACPLFSGVRFGDKPNGRGSLRHNANALGFSVLVLDYDDGRMQPEEAARRLRERGIACFVYTSASHTREKPRWRVVIRLSREHEPGRYADFVSTANGALGGILAPESWTLSQAFYFGWVEGAEREFIEVEGRPLDELVEAGLAPELIGKPRARPRGAAANPAGAGATEPLGLSVDEMRKYLLWLDFESYLSWLAIGQGLHEEYRGEIIGFDLWDEGSQTSDKYPGREELLRKWNSFGDYDGPRITARTLIRWANEAKRAAQRAKDEEQGTPRRALTEFGNAERLIDRYGGGLMFIPELNQWYGWSDTHWRPGVETHLELLAKDTVKSLREEADQFASDEERESLSKFCARSQRAAMVASMVRLASSDPRVCVPAGELDSDPNLLGVGNGAVDLHTGRLLEPDPKRRITIAAGVEYDPHAQAPLFEQTVSDAFYANLEMVGFFHRLMGYILLGQPNEDALVIPYGEGSNAKSTILGAIREALGAHAKSAAAESFLVSGGSNGGAPREDLLRLRGARLVHIAEPDTGSVLREGLVKALTGGDSIVVRGPYQKRSIEFTPSFVPILPTNHRPIIKGDDHGIWRRILLVPFTRNFDKDPTIQKDPHRAEKLRAELPGILRWLVEGALAYQRDGLCTPSEVVGGSR